MQDILAILIVAIAAAFLAQRAWRHVTKRAAGRCGSCANCSGTDTDHSQQLVTIMPFRSSH
jgi:hypothetical protein